MPSWTPTEDWLGQDAFVIGGGYSLHNFDWSLLHPELTIGCNTAFKLGVDVCKMCVFGDETWFKHFLPELAKYKGAVFTNCNKFKTTQIPWLWFVPRQGVGLYHSALGWNGNTGAAAINLALILGAKRVYLLGFDMKRIDNKPNWHTDVIRPEATKPYIYETFKRNFKRVVKDWHAKFGDREIWNVTADSGLDSDMFPWVNPEVFWAERAKLRTKGVA